MSTSRTGEVHVAQTSVRDKDVPVVIHTNPHPAQHLVPHPPQSAFQDQVPEPKRKQHILNRLKSLHKARQKPHHISMPHYVDGAPPTRADIWGETLTWGTAAAALIAVISLSIVFFSAMQFFSKGNTKDILNQTAARLEQAP